MKLQQTITNCKIILHFCCVEFFTLVNKLTKLLQESMISAGMYVIYYCCAKMKLRIAMNNHKLQKNLPCKMLAFTSANLTKLAAREYTL